MILRIEGAAEMPCLFLRMQIGGIRDKIDAENM